MRIFTVHSKGSYMKRQIYATLVVFVLLTNFLLVSCSAMNYQKDVLLVKAYSSFLQEQKNHLKLNPSLQDVFEDYTIVSICNTQKYQLSNCVVIFVADKEIIIVPKSVLKGASFFMISDNDLLRPQTVVCDLRTLKIGEPLRHYMSQKTLHEFFKYLFNDDTDNKNYNFEDIKAFFILSKDLGFDENIVKSLAQKYFTYLKEDYSRISNDIDTFENAISWAQEQQITRDQVRVRCARVGNDTHCTVSIPHPTAPKFNAYVISFIKNIVARAVDPAKIKSLIINNSYITEVDYQELRTAFSQLQVIQLRNNLLYKLDKNDYNSSSSLKEFYIVDNPLHVGGINGCVSNNGMTFFLSRYYDRSILKTYLEGARWKKYMYLVYSSLRIINEHIMWNIFREIFKKDSYESSLSKKTRQRNDFIKICVAVVMLGTKTVTYSCVYLLSMLEHRFKPNMINYS